MINTLCAILLVAAPPADAVIHLADGTSQRASLVDVQTDRLTVQTPAGQQQIAATAIKSVELADAAPLKPDQRIVQLRDGSVLPVEEFLSDASTAQVTRVGNRPWQVPTSALRWVRLQSLGTNESLLRQWQSIVDGPVTKDIVVYRVEREGRVQLEVLDGIVHGVTAEEVDFEFEGDRIRPKRERVVGIVFWSPENTAPAPRSLQIVQRDGARWNVSTLQADGQLLRWKTSGGIDLAQPWDSVARLDFAVGNWLYLSDMTPEAVVWRPFIESRLPAELLASLYQPRFDQSFDGGPIRVAGRVWQKGLALHSYNEVTYRVPNGYRRFQATAGMDDRVAQLTVAACAVLRVTVDGQVVFEQQFTGQTSPVELDIPVKEGRRLTITVDFGQGGDTADILCLAEARLSR
jgi:hypothetical protein